MNFLIDTQLPPSLCIGFISGGHYAIHTKDMPKGNNSTDNDLIEYARKNDMIIVTKDIDFFHSHILYQNPEKLLLIKTGNTNIKELKSIFERHFDLIIDSFKKYKLIELHRDSIIRS